MQAFADVVRAGKALYIGVSEWTAEQIRAGQELATQMGFRLVSNQPQYSALWRVIEDRVVPTSQELGLGQIVWSPMAQGVLSGKYLPGQEPPAGSRATDDKGGRQMISRWMRDDVLTAVQALRPIAQDLGLTMPQLAIAWVLRATRPSPRRSWAPRAPSSWRTRSGPQACTWTTTSWPPSTSPWATSLSGTRH